MGGAGSTSTSSTSSTSTSSGMGGAPPDGGPDDAGPDVIDAGDPDAGDAGPTGMIVLLAAGSQGVFVGEYSASTSTWTTTTLVGAIDPAAGGVAIAATGPTSAVGVLRANPSKSLQFTTWAPGAFSALANVAAGVTTSAKPWITATPGAANVVFHGEDFKHYFARRTAAWSPTAEAVQSGAIHSFGPSPASITALGADLVIAYAGNDNNLYDQTRQGGTWLVANGHGIGGTVSKTPTIIAPTAVSDLLIAYVDTNAKIRFTAHTNANWTAPADVHVNALTNDPVTLLALPLGEVLMVYRGQDQKMYTSRYTPGAMPLWSAPIQLAAGATTPSPPSLAAGVGGVGGHTAELVFIDAASASAKHMSLTGMAWSAVSAVGGNNLSHVAITSVP